MRSFTPDTSRYDTYIIIYLTHADISFVHLGRQVTVREDTANVAKRNVD